MNSLALPSHEQLHRFGELEQIRTEHFVGVDACLSLLKTCSNNSQAKWAHAYLALHGLDQLEVLFHPLLVASTKFGGLDDSLRLFHQLPCRTIISWTSVLSSCVETRAYDKCFHLYRHMQGEGTYPNSYTFVTLLKACSGLHNMDVLAELHADIKKQGLGSDPYIGSSLVSLYGQSGRTMDAENVFSGLVEHDLVSRNAMLLAYVEQGEEERALLLYRQLLEEGVKISERTFVLVLQACGMLVEREGSSMQDREIGLEVGRSLHADALKSGFCSNLFVASTLINLYSKHGSIEEAENVFTSLMEPDTVLWNAMLSAYVEQGQADQSFRLYLEMLKDGFPPSDQTFTILFQACCMLAREEASVVMEDGWITSTPLEIGRLLHEDACRNFLDANLFIRRTLVEMYGTSGCIVEAEAVFFKYPQCDCVLLNAMISEYVKCDCPKDAVDLYEDTLDRNVVINDQTIIVTLQAVCILAEEEESVVEGSDIKASSLYSGRLLHADAQIRGYDIDIFVACTLLTMYGKCASISEAENVFTGLCRYDMVLWTSMLSIYVDHGKEVESFYLYRQMKEEGVESDEAVFVVLLQACSCLVGKGNVTSVKEASTSESLLEIGHGLHADFKKSGLNWNALAGNSLLNLYGKCGSIQEVVHLFTGLQHRDTMTWNALLVGYAEQGLGGQVLQLYVQMQKDGFSANRQTFTILLKACCMLLDSEQDCVWHYESIGLSIGQALHIDACSRGFDADVAINSLLLHLYGKCGSIDEAEIMFSGSMHLKVVSWTVMLSVYVHHGQGERALRLYRQMHEEGTNSDEQVFVAALQACCALADEGESELSGMQTKDLVPFRIGQAIHVDALRKGYILNAYVRSSLLCVYRRCADIMAVEDRCFSLLCDSPVTWNAMISAYIEHSYAKKALLLYLHMQKEGIGSDEQTYLLILRACCILAENEDVTMKVQERKLMCLEIGRALELDASRNGLHSGEFVTISFLIMYGKCGSVGEAEALFSGLLEHSTAVWNALASVYVENNQFLKVLELYHDMKREGPSPDERTFVIVLRACGNLEATAFEDMQLSDSKPFDICWKLHADALKSGFDRDPFVGNALLSMYGKSERIMEAESIFGLLSHVDVVSWNAMLSAYVRHGREETALELYRCMQEKGVILNDVSFICILEACKKSGRAEFCMKVHFEIVSSMRELSLPLATSLIAAYCSCGCVAEAQEIFDSVPRCGVVLWSALLACYAQEGNALASLHTYIEMQLRGIEPDEITFLLLLSAYNHAGLVQEGAACYESLGKNHDIVLNTKHFVSYVDLLGRTGDLARAEALLVSAAVGSNLIMWLSVLRACGKHGNVELGKVAFNQAVRMQPQQAIGYVLMSNFYADTENWERGDWTLEK